MVKYTRIYHTFFTKLNEDNVLEYWLYFNEIYTQQVLMFNLTTDNVYEMKGKYGKTVIDPLKTVFFSTYRD